MNKYYHYIISVAIGDDSVKEYILFDGDDFVRTSYDIECLLEHINETERFIND
jgi:hypothetical protein